MVGLIGANGKPDLLRCDLLCLRLMQALSKALLLLLLLLLLHQATCYLYGALLGEVAVIRCCLMALTLSGDPSCRAAGLFAALLWPQRAHSPPLRGVL